MASRYGSPMGANNNSNAANSTSNANSNNNPFAPAGSHAVPADDQMFSFLGDNNAKYRGGGGAVGGGASPSSPNNATGAPNSPNQQQQQPNYTIGKGLDQSAASDFRDTVLFLVHQQSQRHNDLVGLVRELAGDVGRLRKDIRTGGGVGGAGTPSQTVGASAAADTNNGTVVGTEGDVVASATAIVGFGGSYASTQQAWVKNHTQQTTPMAYLREEELHAARKRIDDLEQQVEHLKLQVRRKDETIRRLTDANVSTLLSSQSTIVGGVAAAAGHHSMMTMGADGGASSPANARAGVGLGALASNAAVRANSLSNTTSASASKQTAALLKASQSSAALLASHRQHQQQQQAQQQQQQFSAMMMNASPIRNDGNGSVSGGGYGGGGYASPTANGGQSSLHSIGTASLTLAALGSPNRQL